jgi:hypothetical protein
MHLFFRTQTCFVRWFKGIDAPVRTIAPRLSPIDGLGKRAFLHLLSIFFFAKVEFIAALRKQFRKECGAERKWLNFVFVVSWAAR